MKARELIKSVGDIAAYSHTHGANAVVMEERQRRRSGVWSSIGFE